MSRFATVLSAGLLLTAACNTDMTSNSAADSPAFAHESNNAAELSSATNPSLGGTAIVNYVAGQPGWRSTVNVTGDLANGPYDVILTRPNFPDQVLCSFAVDGNGGLQGCSTDKNVNGFAGVEVRDANGTVIVNGTFARRGGNRDKD